MARDVLSDVLKGFGAVLVVLGHCIQLSYGNNAFFEDRLYQFIYSFHMPLFMVISGYYAWNSVRRAATVQDRWRMIRRKCVYLAVPNVAWKLIDFVYWYAAGAYAGWAAGAVLKDILVGIMANFWFLWAVLYSFLLVCLMHYKLRDSVWIYSLVFIAMFFTPDGLALMACKYVLPYYLIGFYANKNKEQLQAKVSAAGDGRGRRWAVFWVSGLLFLILVSFYDTDSFIYLTGYKLIGKDYGTQLRIDLYRFFVGFCGIVFWGLFWSLLLNLRRQWRFGVRALAYMGSNGMGIYIVSSFTIRWIDFQAVGEGVPRYAVNLVETVFVVFCSIVIVEVLGRIKWIRMIVGK